MNVVDEIRQIAVSIFYGILYSSAEDNAPFKVLITSKIGEDVKPMLLVGVAHRRVEDGSITAFLNPDRSLVEEVSANAGYDKWAVRDLARRRCDMAVKIWVEAYNKKNFYIQGTYKASKFQPAKFAVR